MAQSRRFFWYELSTGDREAAEAFYGRVAGWTTQPGMVFDRPYSWFLAGGAPVGGVMEAEAETPAGQPRGFIGSILVDDVDAVAARVAALGGTVRLPARDVPGMVRFAGLADPQGAAFGVFQPIGDCPPPDTGTPVAMRWHELHAADPEAAFAFYAGLFGWEKGEALDMGPMGTYQILTADGVPFGAVMRRPEAGKPPFWLFYIGVDDIHAAAARVSEAGGTVLNGPMEVPGGSHIVQALDPQGVLFALNGPAA
ncbi:VOC family protein [Azospirillum sp. SYSU D00513]|uniref:VOC family protein n=1 Tax=Azospirillum sp. SYSU D00513 TaxID=2812561 RepID=UPI001A95C9AE|nr:VOC family protein [Azospirillum sp. SYSU D00513]